jgi:hypothetical protein
MSAQVLNHVPEMRVNQGKILSSFGKDSSGLITYQFNQQGFRGNQDFDSVPAHAFFGCSLVFGIGVDQQHIFSSQFDASHNYGLAGKYDNHDVMQVLENFLASDLYNGNTHMAVVWHSRDSDCLSEFYDRLQNHRITHFYCGTPLDQPRCYAVPPQLDQDVSRSHPGPKTHLMFGKMLCALFGQS